MEAEQFMKIDEVGGRAVVISGDDLAWVLERAATVREHDTGIAGPIRILRLGDRVLVQERTPEGELLIRGLPSEASAGRFVEARLAAYERMWDG